MLYTRLIALYLFSITPIQAADWMRHTIETANPESGLRGADGVRIMDINGDDRSDIVTGWEEGNAIRVYLHPGKASCKSPWPAVTVGKVANAEDAVFADLDGDGSFDVISSSEGKTREHWVHWGPANREALLQSEAWKSEVIPQTAKKERWMFCLPVDVNGDGATDLIVGSKDASASISWLQNPGHTRARELSSWQLHRIVDAGWIMSLRLLEDEAGRSLIYSDRKGDRSGIYQLPLLDLPPYFEPPNLIGASGEEVMFLDIANVDDNDRADVIAAIRPDKITIHYQPSAKSPPEEPWEHDTLLPVPADYGTVKAVALADIEGDEIPEFVITCERADGKKCGVLFGTVFSEYFPVTNSEGVKFDRIEMIDIDEDGDLDIVTCEERTGLGVIWHENPR